MTTVAVMQPYFLPYAGYFRLFAAADRVALFDCVQFPRRGWVHRNRLPDATHTARWLTLPLRRAPMDTRIVDLRFAEDAADRLRAQCGRFPVLAHRDHPIVRRMQEPHGDVVGYLEGLLRQCCATLDLPCETVRTSGLDIDPSVRGQARVLAVVRALGGTHYLNLAGGRALYQEHAFTREGVRLTFLPDWQGENWSILYRLLTEPAADIAADIRAQL